MNTKQIVESLSMDFLRVASGLHRGSLNMARQFKTQALEWIEELESREPVPYLKKLLEKSRKALESEHTTADDLLMYGILFRNFAMKYKSFKVSRARKEIIRR